MKRSNYIIILLLCISVFINIYMFIPNDIFDNSGLNNTIVGTYEQNFVNYDNNINDFSLVINSNNEALLFHNNFLAFEGILEIDDTLYTIKTDDKSYIFTFSNKVIHFGYFIEDENTVINLNLEKVSNIPVTQE